jgi:photosystem II stability/assembly factor-like uncharacterized protein
MPSVSRLDLGLVADFGGTMLVPVFGQVGGNYSHYVYRSTDHGATWSYLAGLPLFGQLVFLTPTHWIELAASVLSETTDAGRTWHAVSTDYSQAAGVAPQVVFGDANTGYVSLRGFLERTTDAGAHWRSISTPGTR